MANDELDLAAFVVRIPGTALERITILIRVR